MSELLKNILIVRTDRIGDVVLTLPCFKAIKTAYPDCRLSVLVSPATVDIIKCSRFVDNIIVDDRKFEHKGCFGFLKLMTKIKSFHFDLVIVLHTKKRTNALCFFSGIPKRLGYKNDKFGFLLTEKITDERHLGLKHESEYCMDILKYININSKDLDLNISVCDDDSQWAQDWINQNKVHGKLIAVHAGASDPAKMWSVDNFIGLLNDIHYKYQSVDIVLIGASNARNITSEILMGCKFKIYDLTCKTTVGQVAGLLKRSSLLISNDSGPVHIASGVKTPVVSIFVRNAPGINPERWRPLGDWSHVVSVLPSDSKSQSVRKKEVLEAVDSIFKLC